jgi:hypothetical protein
MRKLLASAIVMAALPMMAQSNTATGVVAVTINPLPAVITHTSNAVLNFGTITASGGPQGWAQDAVATNVGTATQPGCDSFNYTIDPNSIASVNLSAVTGINPLLVGAITLTPSVTKIADPTAVPSQAYSGILYVGGHLTTVNWPKPGNYSSGSYTVTLLYN